MPFTTMDNGSSTNVSWAGADYFFLLRGRMSVRHYDSERLCIIKGDCGRYSRLARTQHARRVRADTTTTYTDHYAKISGKCDVACVFHAHTDVPVPDSFLLVGRRKLQENIHTIASLSSSVEYVSVFARSCCSDGVKEQHASFCHEIDTTARRRRVP